MNSKITTSAVLIGALLLPAMGHAADSGNDRSSPKTLVKDSVITTKIKAKLAAEKITSAVHISVDTDKNGIVTLSGKVKSRQEAEKAVSLARNVEGVVAVENHIKIATRQ